MKAVGYVYCSECGALVRGYVPRGGDESGLHAFRHGGNLMGARCDGSYRLGQLGMTDRAYEATKLPPAGEKDRP